MGVSCSCESVMSLLGALWKGRAGGAGSEPLQGDVAEGFTHWELLVLEQLVLPEPLCLPFHGMPGTLQN